MAEDAAINPIAAAWGTLGGFVLVALVAAIIGYVRVAAATRALRRRTDALRELPVLRVIALTQARLELSSVRFEAAANLLDRAAAAVGSMGAAFTGLQTTMVRSTEPYRRAGSDLNRIRTLFGRRSSGARTPGN